VNRGEQNLVLDDHVQLQRHRKGTKQQMDWNFYQCRDIVESQSPQEFSLVHGLIPETPEFVVCGENVTHYAIVDGSHFLVVNSWKLNFAMNGHC